MCVWSYICECGVVLLACRALYRQFVAETILNPHKFEGGNDGTLIDHVSRIVCVCCGCQHVCGYCRYDYVRVCTCTTMYVCIHVYDIPYTL